MNEFLENLGQFSVNPMGEPVTVLGASKTRTAEEIVTAFRSGVPVMGENRAQEFRDKYEAVAAAGIPYRFIGRLQTNKLKYLIGKVDLIESVDRDELLNAIEAYSAKAGVITDVLLQVNGGNEEAKGGYELGEVLSAAERAVKLAHVRLKGLMAVLPETEDEARLTEICRGVRRTYDELKRRFAESPRAEISVLSMGMSGDYQIAVACGSNQIRIGRKIFGERDYH